MISAPDKENELASEILQLTNLIKLLEQDNTLNRRYRILGASLMTALMTSGTVLFFYFLNPVMAAEVHVSDELKTLPVDNNSTCCDLSDATDVHHGRECCNDFSNAYAICLSLCEELDSSVGYWQIIYYPAAYTLLLLTIMVYQAAYGFIFSNRFCNETRHLSDDTQAIIDAADFEWLEADMSVSDILAEAKSLLLVKHIEYKNEFGVVLEEIKEDDEDEKKIYPDESNRYPLWSSSPDRSLRVPLLSQDDEKKEHVNGLRS